MRLYSQSGPNRPALLLVLGLSALATPAFGQATEAQTSAIRSNCRSDFISHCAGVKTGGVEAFQCLKKNETSLSAGCRAAVDAIAAPAQDVHPQEARPAAPAHPAPAAAAPAPPPAAGAPTMPHPAASTPKATAAPETAPKPAARKPAASRPGIGKPTAAATPTPAPTAQPPAAMPAPKIDSPGEARLIRRFCFTDFKVLCAGVKLGQGRALQCLAANAPALSPGCRQAMAQAGR
jgi:hypothetical protein